MTYNIPPHRPKVAVLLWLIALVVALVCLSSCARLATDTGIRREARQRGFLDITIRDSFIYRESVRADTTLVLDTLVKSDTIYLTKERLKLRIVKQHDTLRISGECEADTIKVPIVRTIVKPADPEPSYWWVWLGGGFIVAFVLIGWRRR